jgi:hypothetical protein
MNNFESMTLDLNRLRPNADAEAHGALLLAEYLMEASTSPWNIYSGNECRL